MTTNRISHTNCSHEATSKARAACRKARAAGTTMPTAEAAKADVQADFKPRRIAQAPAPRIASISWDAVTCDRCSGSGTYPSSSWDGICLKCRGAKTMLTRAGKAAKAAYDAYLEANHTKLAIELQPGDFVLDHHRWVKVHEVDTTIRHNASGYTTIGAGDNAYSFCSVWMTYTTRYASGTNVVNQVGPYSKFIVRPRGEAAQAAFRAVADRKGAHVTYAD